MAARRLPIALQWGADALPLGAISDAAYDI